MAAAEEVESLCMRCGENGTTRILLTSIPHFREIALMAFECPHCNERNSEVHFTGKLQPHGCRFTLKVPQKDVRVLNRQVVKSDTATITIPELEFEVPPEAQKGVLSTVEGVLVKAADDMDTLQEERREADPRTASLLDAFIVKLRAFARGEEAFTFILEDPAGNSFIENPHAPATDPLLELEHYDRTPEQQADLGYLSGECPSEATNQTRVGAPLVQRAIARQEGDEVYSALIKYSAPEEVMTFPATCGACGQPSETRMYMTNIPYFKEVIVMATTCDSCGFKDSEIKAGGSIPAKGKKISVSIRNKADLSRDLIKSDTAHVSIPEIELELMPGTLGGFVTTVEGLVLKISEKLKAMHTFQIGDSAAPVSRQKWAEFDAKLQHLRDVEEPWTLVLDDALANSFVAPSTDSAEDSQITVEEYERSWQQNEELGLNEMDA